MERNIDHGGVAPEPHEKAAPDRARIYVASLADYNHGRLHGRWIDADQLAEDIQRQVGEMLEESPLLSAEEYAIHDYEGFGPIRLSEYESLETVARLAQGITEHGAAFAHWADAVGLTDEDQLSRFEDSYLGRWTSATDYAEELIDDVGVDRYLDEAGVPFREYIRVDVEGLARDLAVDHYFCEGVDGVYVFRA